MEFDYRETKEGKWRFENEGLYQKTVDFQNLMAVNGIAWHNPFSDECTSDFGCCTRIGNYHTRFPASQSKWIPIEIPPTTVSVLVSYKFGVTEAKYSRGKFLLKDFTTEIPEVTHYQYLPEKYKEEL